MVLSAILTATVLFPQIDVTMLTEVLFGVLAGGLAGAGLYVARGRIFPLSVPAGGRMPKQPKPDKAVRDSWTMPRRSRRLRVHARSTTGPPPRAG